MKRKPSGVSIILFILLFVILYFVEQKLNILATTINTGIDVDIDAMDRGNASFPINSIWLKLD